MLKAGIYFRLKYSGILFNYSEILFNYSEVLFDLVDNGKSISGNCTDTETSL